MLSSIKLYGGALLTMMGQQSRSESLFYNIRMEDHIPHHHHQRLVEGYDHMGHPSIDPEVLLRILLIGYLYGITSERRLVEDVQMHLSVCSDAGM